LSLGGSTLYSSPDKTNKNKYTQNKRYDNTVNTSTNISKTPTQYKTQIYNKPQIKKPTHYKTHTYTLPHITKPAHKNTHTLKNPHVHTSKHYKTKNTHIQTWQNPHNTKTTHTQTHT